MYPTYAPAHDPTAVVGRRIGAWIIDAAIGSILFVVLVLSTAETRSYTTASAATDYCDVINNDLDSDLFCVPADTEVFLWEGSELGLIFLVTLGFWFLNDAVLTGITGFSIGKGLVGLRVVRQRDGQLAGFGRCLGRWALWVVDGFPYCIPLVGLATGLGTTGHRRVGDMAAGTLVVDKHQVGHVPVVPGLAAAAPAAAPWGPPPAAPGWNQPPAAPGWNQPPAAPGWNQPPAAPGWNQPPAGPWGAPPTGPSWGPPAPGAPGTPPWGPPPGVAWNPPPAEPGAPAQPGATPPWAPPQQAPAPWAPPAPAAPPPAEPTWAPPTGATSWPAPDQTAVQPIVGPEPAPTQQLPIAGTPGVDAPLWDDARDAYIQWDPEIARWVQWDEAAQQWRPI